MAYMLCPVCSNPLLIQKILGRHKVTCGVCYDSYVLVKVNVPASKLPAKRESWHQDGPLMQMAGISGAIAGISSNMVKGIGTQGAKEIEEFSTQIQELLIIINYGYVRTWPPPEAYV